MFHRYQRDMQGSDSESDRASSELEIRVMRCGVARLLVRGGSEPARASGFKFRVDWRSTEPKGSENLGDAGGPALTSPPPSAPQHTHADPHRRPPNTHAFDRNRSD